MKNLLKNLLYFYMFFWFLQITRQEFCDGSESLSKLKASLTDSAIASSCKKQILDYVNGIQIKAKWALNSMLYSGAVPVPTTNILGVFDICMDVKSSGLGKSNITGQYCLVSVLPSKSAYNNIFPKHQSVKPGDQLATCVPSQCHANDTQSFYSLLGLNVSVTQSLCQTKNQNLQMTPVVIVATIIFSIIFVAILSATVYDYFYHSNGTLLGNVSLRTNFHRIVSERKTNQLLCLHGIRAIGTVGVLSAHVQLDLLCLPTQNSWYISTWSTSIFGAILLNTGTTAVQTFFLLSGFLVGYTYMNLLERNGQLNIIKYYVHRYFRLTPAIAAVLLFYVSYFQYLGSGPFWPSLVTQLQVGTCYKQWWMVLLYIQNYKSGSHYCIGQSWYLNIDMQLFILSPILLYIIKYRLQCFLTICKAILLGSFLYTIFIALYFKPPLSPSSFNAAELTSSNAAYAYSVFNDSVIVNATPWITGVGLSYLVIINQKKNVIILSKLWLIILWTFSALTITLGTVIMSIVTSSLSNHNVLQATYSIFYRISWSITLAWVIFACIFNYAGCINNFLSSPIFQFLSKLSYSTYLVHNAIIFTIVSQFRYPIVFGNFEILSMMCATIVFTVFIAALLMLFIELPSMVISEYFFKRKESKINIQLVSKDYTENNK